TLRQTGNTVTGDLVTPDATPGAVTGQISGTSLTLSRNTGLDTIQHYQLTVQGDSFSGTYRNEGKVRDSGSFTGTRQAASVAGTWNVVFKGSTTSTMTLQQNGTEVTGNLVTPDATPGAVTGQINGTSLTLSRNTGLDTIQHYQVTVQGESFTGTYRNQGRVQDSGSFNGTRTASASAAGGMAGGMGSRRAPQRRIANERALDLCRAEVHSRGVRDYGFANIDITSVGVDTSQGRRNWVTGTFTEGGGGYRFNCSVDYGSGQVGTVEILRPNGSALQPRTSSGTYSSGSPYGAGNISQPQILRACQDAVVARVNQAGYQNVQFTATGIDPQRSGWVTGTVAASRVLVTDTFDFGCSMDFGAARVLDVQLNRR
ncbi:MAG TPA: hypothetical protein VLH09_12095, partial [Bryobacteraceae bacterium]|nr:hypothetical protein [Bryobacteraceae bacterium]